MQSVPVQPVDHARSAVRAAEIIETAVLAMREGVTDGGALERALERAARVSRGLLHPPDTTTFARAVESTHHAVADILAIGSAVREGLDARADQGLLAFAAAQRTLYPIARAHGVQAPPPLPARAPEPAPDERRASPRVELTVDVSLTSETNFFSGFSEDLSDGGLFVATYALKPIGTIIEIEFTLPDGHIVRATAEVRWLRDPRDVHSDVSPGMGLRFKDLPPEDERAINRFVHHRAPIFYDA